jgi:hypothetical protein
MPLLVRQWRSNIDVHQRRRRHGDDHRITFKLLQMAVIVFNVREHSIGRVRNRP